MDGRGGGGGGGGGGGADSFRVLPWLVLGMKNTDPAEGLGACDPTDAAMVAIVAV